MKGSPMQRNFGVGEKESPVKIVWAPIIASAVATGISAAYSANSSANQATKDKAAARKSEELKKSENAFQNNNKPKKKLVKMDSKLTE